MLHLKLQTGLQILFSVLRNRMVYQSSHQKEKKSELNFIFIFNYTLSSFALNF